MAGNIIACWEGLSTKVGGAAGFELTAKTADSGTGRIRVNGVEKQEQAQRSEEYCHEPFE